MNKFLIVLLLMGGSSVHAQIAADSLLLLNVKFIFPQVGF